MAAKRRWYCKCWSCTHRRRRLLSRRWICGAYRVRKPMGRTGMVLSGIEPSGPAFACKPLAVAKPALAWGRFATQWSAATTSLHSLGAYSAGLTIRHVTTWRGQNWRRVSFCCARVLSHDPYKTPPSYCGPTEGCKRSRFILESVLPPKPTARTVWPCLALDGGARRPSCTERIRQWPPFLFMV